MERFSNDYQDLRNEVKKELLIVDLKENETIAVIYSHIPSFPGGQFSVSLILDLEQKPCRLVRRQWDNEYDLERFSSRVYNLDRLCIKNKSFELSIAQQVQVANIMGSIKNFPEKLEREGYIILDGVDYQLTFKTDKIDKVYNWNLATEDIRYFERLIDFLITTTIE